jgi:hypothetical protein
LTRRGRPRRALAFVVAGVVGVAVGRVITGFFDGNWVLLFGATGIVFVGEGFAAALIYGFVSEGPGYMARLVRRGPSGPDRRDGSGTN